MTSMKKTLKAGVAAFALAVGGTGTASAGALDGILDGVINNAIGAIENTANTMVTGAAQKVEENLKDKYLDLDCDRRTDTRQSNSTTRGTITYSRGTNRSGGSTNCVEKVQAKDELEYQRSIKVDGDADLLKACIQQRNRAILNDSPMSQGCMTILSKFQTQAQSTYKTQNQFRADRAQKPYTNATQKNRIIRHGRL